MTKPLDQFVRDVTDSTWGQATQTSGTRLLFMLPTVQGSVHNFR